MDSKGKILVVDDDRRIIDDRGGKIWVESTRGQGSTFRFTLPFTN